MKTILAVLLSIVFCSFANAAGYMTTPNRSTISMICDRSGACVDVDNSLDALITQEDFHHQIHEGNHYEKCDYSTLAASTCVTFGVVSQDKELHMEFEIEGQSATSIDIYDGGSFSGGKITDSYNSNWNSSNVSSAILIVNPTVDFTTATRKYSAFSGYQAETPSKSSAIGLNSRQKEIVLKKNSTAVFRICNKDTGAQNIISYCGEWYEVE